MLKHKLPFFCLKGDGWEEITGSAFGADIIVLFTALKVEEMTTSNIIPRASPLHLEGDSHFSS